MSAQPQSIQHRSFTLNIDTVGETFSRIGGELNRALAAMGARDGLLNVFLAHTSASLCIQENADSDVLLDLADALAKLAPQSSEYRHSMEGPDDMPAHIKTLLTGVTLSIPVRGGRLALGTWQEVYLIEHRTLRHRRRIELDFFGSAAG